MQGRSSMQANELTIGRTVGVTFGHGEDFFTALREACATTGIRQGYIPMFIAGLFEVKIVGACDRLDDPQAPVWSSVYLTNVEALGGGTLAYDQEQGTISPHIHITVGRKEQSGVGSTSHLLSAKVQFLTEMVIREVLSPQMRRVKNPDLYDVPLLDFFQ
jgi:predicted DNA-binding protein with PD1-like motif